MDPVLGCWHNDTLDFFKVSLTSNWTNLPSNLCWWKDNQESAWQLRRSLLSIFMMLTTNQSGKFIHSSPSQPSPTQQQHCTEARQERGENQTDQYRGEGSEGCLLMSQTLINMITCLPQEATKNTHFITKIHSDWLSLQWSTCNHSKLSVNRISITCYRPTTQSFCNRQWQHPENLQRKSKRTAT